MALNNKLEATPPYYQLQRKENPIDFPSFKYLYTPPSKYIQSHINPDLVNRTKSYINEKAGKNIRYRQIQTVNLNGGDYEVLINQGEENGFIAKLTKVEKGDPKLFDNLILTMGPTLDLSRIEIQKGFFPPFKNRLEQPVASRNTTVNFEQGTIFDNRYYQGPQVIENDKPLWVSLCLSDEISLETHECTKRLLDRIIWDQPDIKGHRQYWSINQNRFMLMSTVLEDLKDNFTHGDSFYTVGNVVIFDPDKSKHKISKDNSLRRKLVVERESLTDNDIQNAKSFISLVRRSVNMPFGKFIP